MHEKMHDELKEYLKSFGFSEGKIAKFFGNTTLRDLTIIKAKMEDYKEIFSLNDIEISKLIKICPQLLGYDISSESEGSVKGKIKFYKDLLNIDENQIRKMIITLPALLGLDTISDSERSVKGKIKAYKELLNLNDREIKKMLRAFPQLLCLDLVSDSETSVKNKIKFYKDALNLSDSEVRKMLVISPGMLGLDTISNKSSSVKAKIRKFKQILPYDVLRKVAIKTPMIFSVPAQKFKIRYMIANINGNEKNFSLEVFMTNEKKAWARACYLKPLNVSAYWNYQGEKQFAKQFGITSEELMKVYPLDKKATLEIEKAFWEKTGEKMTLDSDEIKELGLER